MNRRTDARPGRALLTGASSGIGEALARRFASAGHDVVLVARSEKALAALASELRERHGVAALAIACDLTVDGEPARLADELRRRRLAIDILVNNAGVNHQGPFTTLAPQAHAAIVRLNVDAATQMLAHFVPPMVKRGRGRVLNVASTSSFLPVPFMATYAASKAYLLSLTESLSEELRGTGVTVTALCPGVTATPMMHAAQAANPGFAGLIGPNVSSVDEVAEAGYDACMKGQVIRVPGRTNLVMTLSGKAAPKWLSRRVLGFVGRLAH